MTTHSLNSFSLGLLTLAASVASLSAAAYTYAPPGTSSSSQNWSDGSFWSSYPLSGSSTELVFNPTSTFSPNVTLTSVNDLEGIFYLNKLSLSGVRPTSGTTSDFSTFRVEGGTLEFVNNGGTAPVISFSGSGGNRTLNLEIASNLRVFTDLTIDGTGNPIGIISGSLTGTGNLTKTGSGSTLLSGINTGGFSGNVTVSAGTLRLSTSAATANAWVTTGSLNIASGATAQVANTGVSSLTGSGSITANATDSPLVVNHHGTTANVFQGSFGTARVSLTMNGAGKLQLQNSYTSTSALQAYAGEIELPAITASLSALRQDAHSTVKITGTSGTVLGGNAEGSTAVATRLTAGTLHIAPSGSGQDVVLQAASGNYTGTSTTIVNQLLTGSGGRMLLDRGSNKSVTLLVGSTTNDKMGGFSLGRGGVVISAAGGLNQLGVNEKLVMVGETSAVAAGTTGVLPNTSRGVAFQGRGVYFGQDTDATLSGDFLSYAGTGLATDQGFVRFDWASNPNAVTNSFTGVDNTKTVRVTQNMSANSASIFALKVDASTLTLNPSQTLTVGDGTNPTAIILNGGTISGGTILMASSFEMNIYTSLAGGTINSNLTGLNNANRYAVFTGPGVLNYTGNSWNAGTLITDGATLDISEGGGIGTNGRLALNGGVLQSKGTLALTLGGSGGNLDFNLNATRQGGGFAARGGSLTVSLTSNAVANADLVWGQTANFLQEGSQFVFGSITADSQTIFTNALDLGGNTSSFARIFRVIDNVNSTGDMARLTGNITSISANNQLVKTGNGLLVLEGTNTYAGQTVVSEGSLQIGFGGTTGTLGGGSVINNAALLFNRSNTYNVTNVISGTGRVVQKGSGTLVLGVANTYSGGTTVESGTLQVGNASALGTGAAEIRNTGTLVIDSSVVIGNELVFSGGSAVKTLSQNASYSLGTTGAVRSNFAGGNPNTRAAIIDSGLVSNVGGTSLTYSFSATSSALNDAQRSSDVFTLTGSDSDIIVLQLNVSGISESSYLGWLDGDEWVNAVLGNTGGALDGGIYGALVTEESGLRGIGVSYQAAGISATIDYLGAWGYDTTSGSVWAVINHNSSFAAIPEPSTWLLIGLGVCVVLYGRRRRIA
jgi:fibronectin-binding autotransporter adhesin